MTPSRPAEGTQAIVSAIFGALLVVYGYVKDGIQITDVNEETIGAVAFLVGLVASAVTWVIARQQRAGELQSAADGTVQG